ncbi:hypothetical protein [Streptomyces sp. NPDC046685]|uniref:hypothetical protein n=1 Tax=Streptomyces sp. NPDC046685 TaxID=3157202 RepID=UPI0033FE4BC7
MDTEPPAEALMLLTVSTVPGTYPVPLGQLLADAVVHLPVPAAAMLGRGAVPQDILDEVRALGYRQLMAGALAELHLFYARLWFRPGPALRADATAVAIACRKVWEQHVQGADRSGITSMFCLPAASETAWFNGARTCVNHPARTADAPPGLIPAG